MLCLQRNYRFFFMFISSSTILCIYVFVFSWINVLEKEVDNHSNLWKAMSHDILSVFLLVYCFIAVWFVGGLTIFHFYLICTNQVSFLSKFHVSLNNWLPFFLIILYIYGPLNTLTDHGLTGCITICKTFWVLSINAFLNNL